MKLRFAVLGCWLFACGGENEASPSSAEAPGQDGSVPSAGDAGSDDAGSDDACASDAGSSDASRDAGAGDAQPLDCPPEGWCWVRGRPWTIGGDAPKSAFAIGPSGALLSWDVDHWRALPVPTERSLISAAIGGREDLWAADERGGAWHFDGKAWSQASAQQPISRVFVARDGTAWAQAGASAEAHGGAASGGQLLRREGDAWVLGLSPYEYCLGGDFLLRDDGEIWSTGLVCDRPGGSVIGAAVHRHDGVTWQQVGNTMKDASWYPRFERVDQYVRVNAGGAVWQWDGAAWQPFAVPLYPQGLPLAQRAFWDGRGYTTWPDSFGCDAVLRVDASHAWCSGAGQIYFHDGRQWSPTLPDAFADTQPATAWGTLPPALWAGSDTLRAWGSGPSDVYRIRSSTGAVLEHFDGTTWTTVLDDRVDDLDGLAADDVWFATARGPVHFDGKSFTPRPLPDDLSARSQRVQAFGPNRALFSAGNRLFRFDGAWSLVRESPGPRYMVDLAARGSEIWLVEDIVDRDNREFLVHFDGSAWRELDTPKVEVYAELITAGNATWLSTEGAITRLGSDGISVPIDQVMDDRWGASLWIGPDALWITTSKQARRFPL